MAVWERGEDELDSYEGFIARFRGNFDHPLEGREGDEHLLLATAGGADGSRVRPHLPDSSSIQRME